MRHISETGVLIFRDEDIVMIPVRDAPMYYFGYLSSSEPFTISAQNFLQLL